MRHTPYILLALAVLSFVSCGKKVKQETKEQPSLIEYHDSVVGDSMVYGLACDGSNDSVVVVYPFNDGPLVTYSCIDAKQAGRVIGKPSIGDWVGLVPDKEDPTTATMVINLDELKGTWTYPVMPQMKDFQHLSKRMQRRMERKAMQEMPDSVKELYMVPREYGFSLKRSHVAQAVGKVYTGSSLEDDSPVFYPEVMDYTSWFTWNGRLVLFSHEGGRAGNADKKPTPAVTDTLDFVSLDADSLVLSRHGVRYSFHRKLNAMSANAHAQQKAKQAAEQKTKEALSK